MTPIYNTSQWLSASVMHCYGRRYAIYGELMGQQWHTSKYTLFFLVSMLFLTNKYHFKLLFYLNS